MVGTLRYSNRISDMFFFRKEWEDRKKGRLKSLNPDPTEGQKGKDGRGTLSAQPAVSTVAARW